jgi:hypothetical protein
MSLTDDNSNSGRSLRSNSTLCKSLLDASTPELFRNNAFRITGLPVDATTREITKHADKLKMMEELGQGKSVHTGALALKTPPTVDQIREAIQRLKDPELRIIDEFFWFWPRQFGKSSSDPAIKALEGGDADAALEIWKALETSPSDGFIAMHNVAVLRHLLALEWENHYAKTGEFADKNRQKIEKLWRSAFKRWNLLAVDDLLWESVSSRIKHLDDPRLTSGFARRMRSTLPQALDKINAELAVRYAESGRMDVAQVHVQFMRETNEGLDNIKETAELVLIPATNRIEQQIQRAKDRAAKEPKDGLNAARELLDHARQTLSLFELFFGKKSDATNELSDEIANLCNLIPIGYHKETGDNKGCIALLNAVMPIVSSVELRRQIEKTLEVLNGNLAFKTVEPAHALLKKLQDSKEHPSVRLARFEREVAPCIVVVSLGIETTEARTDLLNSAAIVLRTISLDAWNEHQDVTTATNANSVAMKYAFDAEIRQRLIEDNTTLQGVLLSKSAQNTRKSGTGCLVMLGAVALLVLAGHYVASNAFATTQKSVSPVSQATRENDAHSAPNYQQEQKFGEMRKAIQKQSEKQTLDGFTIN